MYSFEGNHKSLKNVDLSGRSKQSVNRNTLVEEARLKRLKRNEQHKKKQKIVIIQAYTRSYLTRKQLKNEKRLEFETIYKTNLNDAKVLCKLTNMLVFFYHKKQDNNKIEAIAKLYQNMLVRSNKFVSVFLLAKFTQILIRLLEENPSNNILLRFIEMFTKKQTLLKVCSDCRSQKDVSFYYNLICFKGRLFSSILHTLIYRLPADSESLGENSPKIQLANSLVDILKRPFLHLENEHSLEVVSACVSQLFSSPMHKTNYKFILPRLAADEIFPMNKFQEFYLSMIDEDSTNLNLWSLAAYAKIFIFKADSFKEEAKSLQLFALLLEVLNNSMKKRSIDQDNFDLSSDEECEEMDVDPVDENIVKISDIYLEVMSMINSDKFSKMLIKILDLSSVTSISFHIFSSVDGNVLNSRFLSKLAFEGDFVQNLWASMSVTNVKNRSKLLGSLTNTENINSLKVTVYKLVIFSSLFLTKLKTLYDSSFYNCMETEGNQLSGKTSSSSFFMESQITSIVEFLRDACLQLIKLLLPGNSINSPFANSFQNVSDIRQVYKNIVNGKIPHLSNHSYSDEKLFFFDIAFKCCSRVLNHLHTRYTRHKFGSGSQMWIPSETAPSADLVSISQRHDEKKALALHLIDEELSDQFSSVQHARQLIILTQMPYVVPFNTRLQIFMKILEECKQRVRSQQAQWNNRFIEDDDLRLNYNRSRKISVKVRRNFIYEDAFNDLSPDNVPDMRKPLDAQFVNTSGLDEVGYGQGVNRAFIQQLVKRAFEPNTGLFRITDDQKLCPGLMAKHVYGARYLEHYRFLGRLLGKIIYENTIVELPFADFFLNKLLHSNYLDINNLKSLDPEYYQNLVSLCKVDDVSDLSLTFSIDTDELGIKTEVDLKPNGRNILVTNDNYQEYIHRVAHYKLNVQMREQTREFKRGMSEVISPHWTNMFDSNELQTLISGNNRKIDIDDLRANCVYNGYEEGDEVIRMFWEVVEDFNEQMKKNLLQFATSCSCPPLLGFKEMDPKFCVANAGNDESRLPTSSTCMNLLKLPAYKDIETMKSKLYYSLQSNAGFELS